jgi:hypothetical protein
MQQERDMVEWREEVLTVLDAWLAAKGGTGGGPPQGTVGTGGGAPQGTRADGKRAADVQRRPRRIAEARFQGDGGCYTVDLRGTPLALDGLEGLAQLTLRGGEPDRPEYRVLRAHEANGLVHVRVGRHVTAPRLYLWAVRRPPTAPLEAARRALADLEEPGLAARLARGELDAPSEPADEPPDGPASLDPGGQRQAFASCQTPGVFLVWGPPGTGKTEVLSQAVERLVDEGRRVLLVAPFGIAVDAALQRTLLRSAPRPGTLLRVGPPQLAEIAASDEVCLDDRAASACGSVETARRDVEAELLRIAERPERARELEAQLEGHDAAAYARASELVRREDERTRLFVRELEVRDRLAGAARDEQAEAARLAALRERWERTVEDPLEPAAADRLQLDTDEAASAWATAAAAARSCEAELEQVTRRLDELTTGARPTEAERALVHAAEAQHLPQLQEELEALREKIERDRERRPVLEAEHEEWARELERRREGAERACVEEAQVVATTVARALIDPAVAHGRYDAVLIDEAAAVPVPLLLPLVARAERTAVLFGDFRRPGGAVEDERRLRELGGGAIESWLLDGVFARCGVRTPAEARDGHVITLDCVDRLGADVLALANATSYDDRLWAAPSAAADSPDEAEVVLFDTDGLDDLGSVRYQGSVSGWWPVGSLLSASLARQSHRTGETVGLLTPYGPQAAATAEVVRDVELGGDARAPLADVATVQCAQGGRYDTVVLDLVESSEREGWVRRGSWDRGRWERSGARMLTSAITRAGRRLALIASGEAVRAAGTGSVLAPLRTLIEAGRVPVVPAATFLCRLDLPVLPARDERELTEALRPHLEGAERSIWIWAPWTLDRLAPMTPLLRAARDRGVQVAVFARAGDTGDGLDGAARPVRVEDLRRKLIVVDGRVTMLGCARGGEPGDRDEVLVAHTGPHFARFVLEQEHAELLSAPPRCPRCGDEGVEVRRSAARGKGFPWAWGCPSPGCGWRKSISPRRDGRSNSTRASRKG